MTYGGQVQTRTYVEVEPQITTYTTHHHTQQYVPVAGGEYQYSHSSSGNHGSDANYQTTSTNHGRGSSGSWSSSSYGSSDNAYYPQQRGASQYSQDYGQHHQAPLYQPQPPLAQVQPIYERTPLAVPMLESANWRDSQNTLTEYYSGCPEGHTGQLPYAYDCRRFLNCWHGRGHIQSCPVGTVFNPESLECDRPDKTRCGANLVLNDQSGGAAVTSHGQLQQQKQPNYRAGRVTDATSDVEILCPPGAKGLQPHPSDCSKFINCANGNVHIQDCGPGTAFSATMKVCDFKDKVDCSGRESATRTVAKQADHHSSAGADAGRDLPHNADILCLSGITGIFPYPFDYTKFINCKNGNTAIQNCVQGTAFSVAKGFCESLEQIDKRDHVMYIVSEVSYEYSQTLITCPPGTEGVHLYPFNAEKFIKCVRSQMEVLACPSGQVFSATRRVCMPRQQVLKQERVRLLEELQSSNDYRATEDLYDAHTMVFCPFGLVGTYPHPFDNSKFIRCGGGRMVRESCASGKAYSLSRKVCEMKEDVDVNDRVQQTQVDIGGNWATTDIETTFGSTDGLTYLMCPPGVTGLFLHPFDCTKYLECSKGSTTVETCLNGTVFSISRKECIPRDKVEAYDRVEYMTSTRHEFSNEHAVRADYDFGIACRHGTFGVYPHPSDNRKYMRCANGRLSMDYCAAGQVFCPHHGFCVDETDSASSNDRGSYTRTQENHQHNLGTYEAGTVGSSGSTTTTTTNTYNTAAFVPDHKDVTCPTNANGRYAHPYDCTKFIMCSNGAAHIQSCGPGTAWNSAMEVCDLKHKVVCLQSQSFGQSSQPEIVCPPTVQGLFQHPYDWHKYLSCDRGQTHIMDCGPGTVFSVSRRICDVEDKVGNNDRCNNGIRSDQYDYSRNHHTHSTTSRQGTTQWSYNGEAHHHHPSTTNTQTQHSTGDRWTNMNVPRPGGASFDQQTDSWQHSSGSNYRPGIQRTDSSISYNVEHRDPSQTVVYEQGSLQPGRNYIQSTSNTPLAPLLPTSTSTTSTTSTIVHAQPVGSQEESDEVFNSRTTQVQPQFPHTHPTQPNRQNFTRHVHHIHPGSQWVPIVPSTQFVPVPLAPVATHLMPPPYSGPQNETTYFGVTTGSANLYPFGVGPPSSVAYPSHGWPPLPKGAHTTHTVTTQILPPTFSGNQEGQRPLTEPSSPAHTVNLDRLPGSVVVVAPQETDTISSGSHKTHTVVDDPSLFGGLQPPYRDAVSTTTQRPSSPDDESTTQIPLPSGATTPLSIAQVYTKLSNATIQTFPNLPHYSHGYSEVANSRSPDIIGRKVPQQSAIKPTNHNPITRLNSSRRFEEDEEPKLQPSYQRGDASNQPVLEPREAAIKEALQLLWRPYFNSSGMVDDSMASKAESHIMSLVTQGKKESDALDTTTSTTIVDVTSTTPTSHKSSHSKPISRTPASTPHQRDVELILAGEQHNLVGTTTVQSGGQETTAFHDSTVESQHSTVNNDHTSHTHNTDWHKHHHHHSHNPSPSKYQHSRDFHEKHPHLPNPFDESPETLGIDVRSSDQCPFDCGNGRCIQPHEVCNGIDNCKNRRDEENCDHLGYEVRLTGGESPNMGRIEVKILGKWGYVCDDKFGLKDADVVCRELGFKMGAMEVRGSSYYPPTDINNSFNMDEVQCKGNETYLRDCDFKGWGVNNCGPDEVVGVVCKVHKLKCPNNYWLCSKSEECIPTAFLCDVTPDCMDGSDESPQVCNAPIQYRLEGGRAKNEGRLEVFYRGEWGTVCDDDFGLKEAQVVCNSLGFYGKPQVVKNIYGPGSGPIWLDQVSCAGNETTLDQCSHWTWGENNCQHSEDLSLQCTAGPRPTHPTPAPPSSSDRDLQQLELEYEQTEIDDLGKYQGLWQRSSKAIHQQRQCGHYKGDLVDEYAHPEERVINGSIAKRGRHPWQATIRTRGRGGISSHWCGAVVISKKLVLTAAHCLAGYPKGSYFVRMGDHYANIAESSEVDANIENWYIHEKFRDQKHMNNDIALILLKTPVKFNDYIQPVCLPQKGMHPEADKKCTISGWGSIKSGTSTPSNILRSAEVPILSEEICSRKDVYANAMSEGMFCAGFLDENVDACDGDSGGPLVCEEGEAETLYGIISWGQHCGYANHPGVYVRVEKYIDWIYEKINLMIQQGKL